jgi:hypothetical protein
LWPTPYPHGKRVAAASVQASMPLPRPRWNIAPENTDEPDVYVIQNMVPRSVAPQVRIESDEDMQIIDSGHGAPGQSKDPHVGRATSSECRRIVGYRWASTWRSARTTRTASKTALSIRLIDFRRDSPLDGPHDICRPRFPNADPTEDRREPVLRSR